MRIDLFGPPERAAWLDRRVSAAPLFVLFLDFDGTLVDLADRPENVHLDPSMEGTLARLVSRCGVSVVIVSGRPVEDLKSHLPLEGLYLAGNHGLEMEGPTIRFLHPAAASRVCQVHALAEELQSALSPITGALVENKRLSVACHNRGVDLAQMSAFWAEIQGVLSRDTGAWRVLSGKRVVEFLPSLDWTKGSCARFLMTHFESRVPESPEAFAVAIGDDRTDRDLLEEVLGRGCAIAVGNSMGSGWDLQIHGVQAVHRLLDRFDQLRSGGVVPSG